MRYTIQVRKDLDDRTPTVLIERVVHRTARRQYVIFNKRRYTLLGGIRCPFFINLDRP